MYVNVPAMFKEEQKYVLLLFMDLSFEIKRCCLCSTPISPLSLMRESAHGILGKEIWQEDTLDIKQAWNQGKTSGTIVR